MMDWIDDPSSFVVGLSMGVAAGVMIRHALGRFRTAMSKYRQAKELENGSEINGHASV